MASIRVNSGVLKVEVNDNGDTISLRKDMNFINNIMSFADGLGVLQSEFQKQASRIAPDDTDAKLELLYAMHKELHDALENLFGAGTCRKVFGDGEVDVIPTMDAVVDFCEQIAPFIQQIAQSLGAKPKTVHTTKPKGYMGGTKDGSRFNAFNSVRQQIGGKEPEPTYAEEFTNPQANDGVTSFEAFKQSAPWRE
jgi:hypothetical protein